MLCIRQSSTITQSYNTFKMFHRIGKFYKINKHNLQESKTSVYNFLGLIFVFFFHQGIIAKLRKDVEIK